MLAFVWHIKDGEHGCFNPKSLDFVAFTSEINEAMKNNRFTNEILILNAKKKALSFCLVFRHFILCKRPEYGILMQFL